MPDLVETVSLQRGIPDLFQEHNVLHSYNHLQILMESAELCFSESLMTGNLSVCPLFKRMLRRSAA